MTNEEKILKLLEQHSAMLEKQDIMLDRHSAMLEKQGIMSDRHSAILEQHSVLLQNQGAEIVNINLTLENRIFPQLQLLAEGQKTILEALTPKSRVEALEDEMAFMKQVVRAMSSEIQELKKAQ